MFKTPTLKLIVGLGLCSLGGAMLYVYFKNREEEEDDINLKLVSKKKKKEVAVQLVISNEIVPVIVGRSGANIKITEEKTGTIIRFREKDDNNQYCEIRGQPENVERAKNLLTKEIQRSPTVKEEIFVPQSACGKIIGRCGESLQEICRRSLAKVSVDSGDRSSGNLTRRIEITGNHKQVNIAKKLIEEIVKEDEIYRRTLDEAEQKREPRRSPTNSVSSTHSSLASVSQKLPPKEKLNVNDAEKSMEVYVSAIASPAKFWLQIVGPQSKQLDDLVENMTEYYNDKENREFHKLRKPCLGDIVAALFKYDGKWYRAEIVGILPNEYNKQDVALDLYFVDYGDSEYISPHEVFELRTDFLTLRFQAIECYLAHVKPALTNEADTWDPQSIAKFEELTHVASWKKLKSRVVAYKERPKEATHSDGTRSRREGSPIPGVELFDTSDGTEVDIAHSLVAQGYAISEYPHSESNDVLRLGGGYLSSTSRSSETNSPFNINDDNNLNGDNFVITESNGDLNGTNHLQQATTAASTNNFIKNATNNLQTTSTNDLKMKSDDFLQSEKMNKKFASSSDQSNLTNHNHLTNNLLQS